MSNRNNNGAIHGIIIIALVLVALVVAGLSTTEAGKIAMFEGKMHMYAEAPTVDFILDNDPKIIPVIDEAFVDNICANIEQGELFIMVSRGGNIIQGMRLGKCLADAESSLIVVTAASIAPIIALHARNVCLVETAAIRVHQPGYDDDSKLSRDKMLKFYSYINRKAAENGVPRSAIAMYLAYSDLTPNAESSPIPPAVFAAMLGSRFKGICAMDLETVVGLRSFINKLYP